MRFMLNMTCDNAAFGYADSANDLLFEETARLLFEAATHIQDQHAEGIIRDANGNTVGRWSFIDDGEGE